MESEVERSIDHVKANPGIYRLQSPNFAGASALAVHSKDGRLFYVNHHYATDSAESVLEHKSFWDADENELHGLDVPHDMLIAMGYEHLCRQVKAETPEGGEA